MKSINKLIIIILGLFLSYEALAQENENYPDTIIMTIGEGVELTFAFNRISKKDTYFTNELWKATINVMENALESSSITGGKKIQYGKVMKQGEETARIKVSSLEENEVYQIGSRGTSELLKNRIEFEIKQESLLVHFVLNDINDINSVKEINIESLWKQIDQKFKDEGKRNLYIGNGEFNYGIAQIDQLGTKEIGIDNIEIIIIGIGLGYYRDRFVPDWGSKISFNLQDRLGKDWMEFGALYTQQFFFSRNEANNDQAHLNGWITGFWKVNTKKGEEFGIGIGGLIHRDGGYFEGSTWKLSLYNKGANSRFTFSPEMVFTNDFKKVFPALRFGLTF